MAEADRPRRSTSPATPSSSRKARRSRTSSSPTASSSACAGPKSADVLRELYAPFLRTEKPFLVMSPESAEMTKYVANACWRPRSASSTRWPTSASGCGADINDVRRGIGHDSRIGFAFLFPGVGYGGSCFPKDVRALVHMAQRARRRAADDGGRRRGQRGAEARAGRTRSSDHFGGEAAGQDGRHLGPGLQAADRRHPRGAGAGADRLAAGRRGVASASTTPRRWTTSGRIYGDKLAYCDRPYGALEGADALAIMTEWNEFRNPDFDDDAPADDGTRSSSTAATSTTRRGWPPWASPTTASAAPPPPPRRPSPTAPARSGRPPGARPPASSRRDDPHGFGRGPSHQARRPAISAHGTDARPCQSPRYRPSRPGDGHVSKMTCIIVRKKWTSS